MLQDNQNNPNLPNDFKMTAETNNNPPPFERQMPNQNYTYEKKPSSTGFKFDKNALAIAVALVAVVVILVFIFWGSNIKVPSFLTFGESSQSVATKAIDYLNANILQAGQEATLGNVSEESGVVKFQVIIGGSTYDSYITRDGKLLFPQAYELDSVTNGGTNGTAEGNTVKVASDDDAVLGNPNAPLTMVELSDYECPFCKRHFEQVYPKIKRDYIDTGKLKLVFRDFVAVQAHNPLAMQEAMAAECAGEQGGDAIYFKYHDEIFKKTTSNGNGLQVSYLSTIAKNLGLNVSLFQTCLDSQKYKAEFDKDNADALSYLPKNEAGTPSFFIGKSSSDGMIDGTIIKGAQPYESFKTVIDQLLAGN